MDILRDTREAIENATVSPWRAVRLSASEVLALLGWPLEANLPGLPEAHPKPLRLVSVSPDSSRIFATSNAPGARQPLGVGIADSLFHTAIVGPTGSGKSNILLSLILADMKAGRGVVVIDPKSDLIRDVLSRVPERRREDIVVLDPTASSPVGLNPLGTVGVPGELLADGILGIFRELFPSMFGPRTSDVLHSALLTLVRQKGATLTWLPRLMTDRAFRTQVTSGLNDPDGLDSFWAMFNNLSERDQAQYVGPMFSRLRQFLLRPSLRAVLDQAEPRFNVADVFTKQRILLVPLNSGLLGGDTTRLLGSLLVTQLWHLTLARASIDPSQRHPVSIYIDETSEFVRLGHDLSDALARSRSLGVGWHLAYQFREQLNAETRAAIDANAQNLIAFRLNIKDAREIADMAPELTAGDFTSLHRYGIYARLVRNGRQLDWVSGDALPPPPITSNPDALRAESQRRYGRAAVGDELNSSPRSSRPDSDEPIGRQRRSRS